MTTTASFNASDRALNGWYNSEIGLYTWDSPGFIDGVGHFTQVCLRACVRACVCVCVCVCVRARARACVGWLPSAITMDVCVCGCIQPRRALTVSRSGM